MEATMPQALTDLERRALDYIVEYLRENTYQPSIREIGRRFGLKSTKTVSELLHAIEAKGYIERDPSRSRGVRLLGLTLRSETVSVPVLNRLGETVDRYVLDRRLAGAAGAYFLEVAGNELFAEGIRAGDLALIEPVPGGAGPDDLVVFEEDEPGHIRHGDGGVHRARGRALSVLRRLRPPTEVAGAEVH
jgi:repressor LexA